MAEEKLARSPDRGPRVLGRADRRDGGRRGRGRLVCVRSDGVERRGRQINRQREEWERHQNDKCASGGDGGGIIRCVSIISPRWEQTV